MERGNIKDIYKKREKFIEKTLVGYHKIGITEILNVDVYDDNCSYKVDIYVKEPLYSILEKEYCYISGEYAQDFAERFKIGFNFGYENEYHIYTNMAELLENLMAIIKETGNSHVSMNLSIESDNDEYNKTVECFLNNYN